MLKIKRNKQLKVLKRNRRKMLRKIKNNQKKRKIRKLTS